MKEKLTVVKVGGGIIDEKEKLQKVLERFARMDGRKLLVHGGGRIATAIASRLGIETKMVEGRRITDKEMLDVVVMVYAGLVNKDIVARLQALGVNAIGLAGADMDVMRSHKRPEVNGIDYGYVGDVDAVGDSALYTMIESGAMPVLSPITHDGKGTLLNTNADTIAQETAKALAKRYDVTLIYGFEKSGVMADANDEKSVIPTIHAEDFPRLKAEGIISGGMIPKIENALKAVECGVKSVRIMSAKDIGSNSGTIILS